LQTGAKIVSHFLRVVRASSATVKAEEKVVAKADLRLGGGGLGPVQQGLQLGGVERI
jgi:hypothetical protein